MQTKVVLLLILLVFAFTPIITSLAATFNLPTINMVNSAKATAYNAVFGMQIMGDGVDDPVGPGLR